MYFTVMNIHNIDLSVCLPTVVQLVCLVEVTSRYFLTGRCHSSNSLTVVKKTVC